MVSTSLSYPVVACGTNNKPHASCLLGSSGVGQKILTVLLADGAAISKQMATGVFCSSCCANIGWPGLGAA